VIGTPDDLVKMIKSVLDKSGGFGTCVGFVHDWANPRTPSAAGTWSRATSSRRSTATSTKLRESEKYLQVNRAVFERAGQAIMAKIMENKDAAEALKVTADPRFAAAGAQVPKELAARKGDSGGVVFIVVLSGAKDLTDRSGYQVESSGPSLRSGRQSPTLGKSRPLSGRCPRPRCGRWPFCARCWTDGTNSGVPGQAPIITPMDRAIPA
jgi:hypothetical protein